MNNILFEISIIKKKEKSKNKCYNSLENIKKANYNIIKNNYLQINNIYKYNFTIIKIFFIYMYSNISR